ncbi:DUF6480 family protein [Streptomyces sp. NPDC048720]|uniref:DUF6480 family protein n=1 Tax=Streptomyces sp. NPDC048720 TaxID=3365588 RepID=UPI003714F982
MGMLEQQIGSASMDSGEHVERRTIVGILEARLDQLYASAHRLASRSAYRVGRTRPRREAERGEHMTSPQGDASRTAQLAPNRGIPPAETPPAEGSTTSGISFPEPALRVGWGPVPLVLIMLVVVLIAVGLIAMAVALMA